MVIYHDISKMVIYLDIKSVMIYDDIKRGFMRDCYFCKKPVAKNIMLSGLHPECFCRWFEVSEKDHFHDVVARSTESRDKDKDWAQVNTSFFHGKFRKYSACLGNHNYILKVMQNEVPELPLTEYLCNQLARSLGLQVPNHYLILFENKLESFLSINFMHGRTGSDLIHIYRYLDQPKHYDCEHLLKIIEKEVGDYESVIRFIELCLFDSLIGNHDRHGRNIGLIKEPNGTLLAPFYDNPSYLALEIPELLGAYHEPRGAIGTLETVEPLMKDYVKEWSRLGYKEHVVNFAKRVNITTIESQINSSFLSIERKNAILKLIKRRYLEMSNAI